MRVIFFGTHCDFSLAPLRILLEAGHEVCAVVVPARQVLADQPLAPLSPIASPTIPLAATAEDPTIVSLAWEQHIPVYQAGQLAAPELIAAVTQLQADVACVACFPKRIPTALLAAPRLGFLNVHPSLLPAYRGPQPLFWMFRQGDRRFGVTIHFMDEQWDTGDIVTQARADLPDGVSGEEANQVLAQYGGELLVEVLRALPRGVVTRQPQTGGSYYSVPQAADFTIEATWSARRAFNFMRGTAEWGHPYPIDLAAQRFALRQAHFYAADEVLGAPYQLLDDQIDVQFTPGVLRAQLAHGVNSALRD